MRTQKMGLYSWMKILPLLKNKTANVISKELDTTPSHVYSIINEFESLGWITREKNGREILCIFTKKGLEITRVCEELAKLIK